MTNIRNIDISQIHDTKASERHLDMQLVSFIADSFADTGQATPVFIQARPDDKNYDLCDGAHRLYAAKQIKMDSIHAVIFAAEDTKQHIRQSILENDLIHKGESWIAQGEMLLELKLLYEAKYPSTKHGAKKRKDEKVPSFALHLAGKSGKKTKTIRNTLTLIEHLPKETRSEIKKHDLPIEVGRDIKKLDSSEHTAILKELVRIKDKTGSGQKPRLKVATARHNLAQKKRDEECEGAVITSDEAQVVQCRMEEYTGIPAGSIDAVICDPLYHGKHLHLYGEAAKRAAVDLKEGGFAAFYCGRLHLQKAMALLDKHLSFFTLITIKHKEHFGNIGSSKISADCKHILVYQTKGATSQPIIGINGIIEGTGRESGDHEYQQSARDLGNLIDAITNPSETILDYFAGSGSTGVAAILKSRQIILLEEDEVDCNRCRDRLNKTIAERSNRTTGTEAKAAKAA